jgi:dTDP-glucose 4,6-dehydratase
LSNRSKIQIDNQDIWNSFRNKNIFLTGGTGFFGKSFLDLMIFVNDQNNLNCHITVLTRDIDHFVNNFPQFKESSFLDFITGDVCSFDFPNKKFDYILHFATPASATLNKENPLLIHEIITKGTERILNFGKFCKAKIILFASSGAVYGKQPPLITHITENYKESFDWRVLAPGYAKGKSEAEEMGCKHSDADGYQFKIARCFAFVGTYLDPESTYAIANFVRDAVCNKNIKINGDGRDYRSYLSADDLVVALLRILILGANKKAYNVGSDEAISIKELATTIKSLINPDIEIEILGHTDDTAPANRYVPNIDLLKKELNFNPTTKFADAVIEMANYYRKFLVKRN